MVLREVEEASPDNNLSAPPPDDPNSFSPPDDFSSTDANFSPANGIWTVDAVKALHANSTLYRNPFTPIPFYARLLGWSEATRDESVLANVNRTQLYIDRRLTPTEVQAESYYHGVLHEYLYKSETMGFLSFLGLAAVRQNAGKPGLITPYAKRFMGEQLGTWFIRLSRYGIYGFFGRLQGQVIGAMLGASMMREKMKRDPNIANLRRDLAEFRQWSEEELKKRVADRRSGGGKEPLVISMEDIIERHHPHSEDVRGFNDKSGQEGTEQDYVDPNASPAAYMRASRMDSANPTANSPSTESVDDNDFLTSITGTDPNSPTGTPAGAYPRGGGGGGASAWDRLRQGQRPSTSSPAGFSSNESGSTVDNTSSPWAMARQTRPDDPRVSKTDSFTFSATEEERQLAKAEAQREFDARIERERGAGGDGGFARVGSDRAMDLGIEEAPRRGRSM